MQTTASKLASGIRIGRCAAYNEHTYRMRRVMAKKGDGRRLIDPPTRCPDRYAGKHLAGFKSFPHLRLFWPRLLPSPETKRGRNSPHKRISCQQRGGDCCSRFSATAYRILAEHLSSRGADGFFYCGLVNLLATDPMATSIFGLALL
jgi:hypothetical protein